MVRLARALPGSALSNASRYASLQKAFNDQLREWHWQRNAGTLYQVWQPPGVVFSRLKKDHHKHGRYVPPWDAWGFPEPAPAVHLVLRALGGRWALRQARRWPQEQWVIADSNDGHIFNAFVRAMNVFGLDPVETESSFPNVRLLHTNERHAPKFFEPGSLRSVHVHLPWAERTTRPKRLPLVTTRFVADVSDALEDQGELHVVTSDEGIAEETCGLLTRSRRFAPCLAFPFHEAKLPATYPAGDLLNSDVIETRDEGGAAVPFFYTRWEKRPPELPNFRFQGGRGYGEVPVLGLPELEA